MERQPDKLEIRRFLTWTEEFLIEGKKLKCPVHRAVAMAVIANPYAGCGYQEDLSLFTEFGDYLGGLLAKRAREALGLLPEEIEGIGKGCLIGEDGEAEHGAALLHVRYPDRGYGKTFRDQTNGGLAVMMANVKVGAMDATLDIPLGYKDAVFVCSHWDTITIHVPGAPKRDEMVVAAVVTDGGRPNARVPGLTIADVCVYDGQR